MEIYNNINLSLLSPKDIVDSIIRKHNNNYIIGLVSESSSLLHKKKRFRTGGLFCEEIFGLLYLCDNINCNSLYVFNSNPILNRLCLNCSKFMKLNFKRKYRFGAIILNFPIINCYYFKDFINLFKIFKIIKKNYFYKNNIFKLNDNLSFIYNLFSNSLLLENKFLNFINLFYKTTNFLELFKIKLNFIYKKTKSTLIKLNKFNKILDEFVSLKKIFILLFPIFPSGLRPYSFHNTKNPTNDKLNYLYSCLIDFNLKSRRKNNFNYNLKMVLMIHFLIEVILNFSKPINVFKQNNYLYDRLSGKYGVFRQNLLGFRVDYSGRTSIVPGPSLSLNNIGLPFDMIYHHIRLQLTTVNTDEFYESCFYRNFTRDKFEYFMKFLHRYYVIANRAPTLHKMNIHAFNPVLIEGESIKLMPLMCAGYNADFDGDQMGIFSLVKNYALNESLNMLKSLVNLYSPTTKGNVFNLSQGMLAGYYKLTNYSSCKYNFYNYISCNFIDLIESNVKDIFIDSPILLRNFNLFYYTTIGRLLLNFNFNTI